MTCVEPGNASMPSKAPASPALPSRTLPLASKQCLGVSQAGSTLLRSFGSLVPCSYRWYKIFFFSSSLEGVPWKIGMKLSLLNVYPESLRQSPQQYQDSETFRKSWKRGPRRRGEQRCNAKPEVEHAIAKPECQELGRSVQVLRRSAASAKPDRLTLQGEG